MSSGLALATDLSTAETQSSLGTRQSSDFCKLAVLCDSAVFLHGAALMLVRATCSPTQSGLSILPLSAYHDRSPYRFVVTVMYGPKNGYPNDVAESTF